jgi:hypothetical protein
VTEVGHCIYGKDVGCDGSVMGTWFGTVCERVASDSRYTIVRLVALPKGM